MRSRALFAVVLAVAFLVGYGAAAKAWPGVPDRSAYHGYFQNRLDYQGDFVLSSGIPSSVNSTSEFINFILSKLRNGSSQDRTGAAFIIQTMRGSPYSRNKPPTNNEIADWESRVRYAASRGWIDWSENYHFTVNSFWQGDRGGGSNPNDDAYYNESDTQRSIIFRGSSGVAYVLKRSCGNPVMRGSLPGLDENWSATGHTTVSAANAAPGQTVTFRHYVKNNGPTTASIRWSTYNSQTGSRLASGGPDFYTSGEQDNVNNQNFTIPANAVPGSKYCREVGWSPKNSSGGTGRGSPACVTVFVPGKLKAVMGVSPDSATNGETVTFTPSIIKQSSGSNITVNCSIVRVLTPPTGAPSNLGNQPCVDVNGNTSITVTGSSVNLKPNQYVIPDSAVVGSKICDTITITNPSDPSNFSQPGDRTSTACVTVAKTPYVWFMGGDVYAGGGFASVDPACNNQADIQTVGRTLADGSTAGSVAEYSAFALGQINSFGSAGKVLVGSGSIGLASRQLTFANSEPDVSKLGYYGEAQHCINDYTDGFTGAQTVGGGVYIVNGRGSGAWHVAGDLTIAGNMPSGGKQIYYVDGDVTIMNDLKYPGSYGNPSAIPSLIIVTKGNVRVLANVTQMDGMFVAVGDGNTTGVFYTCYPKNEPASIANPCNNSQLTVNGVVAAGRIDLFRSFGASGATAAQRKQAAEQFMENPELFLNNALNSTTTTTIKTTNILDLPPRF